MREINLSSSRDQRLRVLLAGDEYVVRVHWQPLAEYWHVSLSLGETELLLGRRVIEGELIKVRGFQGALVALPVRTTEPLTSFAWGLTHRLFWLSEDEVEQVGTGG